MDHVWLRVSNDFASINTHGISMIHVHIRVGFEKFIFIITWHTCIITIKDDD